MIKFIVSESVDANPGDRTYLLRSPAWPFALGRRFTSSIEVLAGVLLLLCLSNAVNAQSSGPTPSPSSPEIIRYTVLPGANTSIYLTVLPNAVCNVHGTGQDEMSVDAGDPAGGPARAQAMKVFADSDGRMKFEVHPPAEEQGELLELAINCVSSEQQETYQVLLRTALRPIPGMPIPTVPPPTPKERGYKILPALTPDQLSQPSDMLLQEGYPYRPDPASSPDGYAAWLTAVSKPVTVVEPETASNPDVYNSQTFYQDTGTWSGYLAIPPQPFQPYVLAAGVWKVPSVSGELTISPRSSFWVGLGGYGQFTNDGDLFQGGTSQDALALIATPPPPFHLGQPIPKWNLSTTYAWSEVFPMQPEQIITNFPVHPGDEMFFEVWVGWEGGNPDPTGGYQFEQVVNETTSQSILVPTSIIDPDTWNYLANFQGKTAEWIMERPANAQLVPYDLANYHSQCGNPNGSDYRAVTMRLAVAVMEDQSAVAYGNDFGNDNLTMIGATDFLSRAAPIDTSQICFEWVNFH